MEKRFISWSILFLFTIFGASAAAVSFKASVDKSVVMVGDRIQVTFTTNTNIKQFSRPDFKGFQLIQGPMQSYSSQNINGRVSSVSSITYVIQAIEEGTFIISPALGDIGSEILKTDPIEITVKERDVQAERKAEEQKRLAEADKLAENLFIMVTVDKRNVSLGEKVTARYVLYTRENLANLSVNKTPELNGFWSKDVKSLYDNQLKQDVVNYNGKQYNTLELKSTLLYPQRTGDLVIDPIEINAIYQVRSKGRGNSIFDQVFGSVENKEILLKSKSVKVKVNPLPANQPKNFNGAVGTFSASMKANKTEMKANEAINIKITIEGKGNLHLISAPSIPALPDIEVYDPKIDDQFSTSISGVSGKRIFDYLVIPRHEGDFTIPSFEFTYYDLNSKSYKTVQTDSIQLKVAKGDGQAAQGYIPNNKEEIELLNEDIIHIKKSEDEISNKDDDFYGSALFYSLLILPFILLGVSLFYKSKTDELYSDKALLKKTKANKMATKRLSSAKKHLNKGDLASFYQEVGTAVLNYFSDKFNIPMADLSKERITEKLHEKSIEQETITKINELMDNAEMARYAPTANLEANKIYEQAIVLISQIENKIK